MYPPQLLFDYYANQLCDDLCLENIAPVRFEIADDSAEQTSYRFANQKRVGVCYIKFDRNAV